MSMSVETALAELQAAIRHALDAAEEDSYAEGYEDGLADGVNEHAATDAYEAEAE
jgi:flagellar biosynthesis/type III secretory pathway protein FliH